MWEGYIFRWQMIYIKPLIAINIYIIDSLTYKLWGYA